jgi:drug/metabolite transporter (DMT)-like permease
VARRGFWQEAGLWLTILVWSLNFLAVKIGVGDLPPTVFTALRFLIAAPALWLLAARSGGIRVARAEVLPLAVSGLIGIAAYQYLFTSAIAWTDVASAAVLMTLSPAIGAVWGHLSGQDRLRPGNWLGVALGTLGAVIVILGGARSRGAAPMPVLGDAAALGAATLWVVYGVMSAPLVRRLPPLTVTAWQAVFGLAALVPVGLWDVGRATFGWPALAVLYSALPVTVFGLTFWQGATGRLGPSRVLVYLNAEPVIAALAAAWLLHAPLTVWVALGGALSLGGVYLARIGSLAARSSEPVAQEPSTPAEWPSGRLTAQEAMCKMGPKDE